MMPSFKDWLASRHKTIGPKKRKPLPRVSKKRQREGKLYLKKRADYLAKHPFCEAWGIIWPDRDKALTPRATEIHHCARRGKYYLDEGTWVAISREAHTWCHENPSAARRLGLLV